MQKSSYTTRSGRFARAGKHRNRFRPMWPALLCLLTLLASQAQALSFGRMTLDKTADRLADTLVDQGGLKGQYLFISPNDLYDASTGLSLPLAIRLRGALMTAMSKRGVEVLLPGADEERFAILQGTWQKMGQELVIDLKVMHQGPHGPEALAAASERVSVEEIDPAALTPDMDSWARFLMRKLEKNLSGQHRRTVHLGRFATNSQIISDRLGNYLNGWLRPALAESPLLQLMDPQHTLPNLSPTVLRTRGIRPQSVMGASGASLTADLLDVDAELTGEAWLHEHTLEIRLHLRDRMGRQLSSAAVEVPKGLFPAGLATPQQAGFKANDHEPAASGLSQNGLRVDLTTTRGETLPFYRDGEPIRFMLRTNRPAWIYLFDFNPAGEAVLLYPIAEDGTTARLGQAGFTRQPEKPLLLPNDGYAFDLVASPPYGKDTVWAVASEIPLELPDRLTGDWERADRVRERLRLQGLRHNQGYAEAHLQLMTGTR